MKSPREPRSPSENIPPEFAEFLLEQRNHLGDGALAAHSPKFFDGLVAALRGEPVSSTAETEVEVHGDRRWQQHDDLEEVLAELGTVRRVLLAHGLDAFADAHPETSQAELRGARECILRFCEDAAADSVRRSVHRSSHQTHARDLSLSEQRRLALDSAQMGWWQLDLASKQVFCDERFRTIFGTDGAVVSYDWALASIHPDDRAGIEGLVRAAIDPVNPTPYSVEHRLVRGGGALRWVAARGQAIFEGEGAERRAVSLVGTVIDVTEAKATREALSLSEERHRLAIDGAQLGTFSWELPSRRIHWNARMKELFFLPPEAEISFEVGIAHLHPDDREPTRRAVEEAIAGRTSYQIEYRSVNPADGQTRWLHATGRAFADPVTGELTQLHGVVVDLTLQKLAREQAVAAARRERTILDSITDSFFAFDTEWRFTYLNEAARRGMAPYVDDPSVLLGRNFFEVFPYNRGTPIEQAGLRAMSEGVMAEFEMFYEPWERWYYGRCFPILGGGLAVYFRETTQEREAAKVVQTSEAKYRSLFNSIDQAFCVIEMIWDAAGRPVDYRFVEVNHAMEQHTGWEKPVGQTARELIPNLEDRWPEIYGRVARTGEPTRFVQGAEGMGRVFDVYAFRLGSAEHPQVGLIFQDIPERRRAEAQLAGLSDQRRLALNSARLGWWHHNLETGQVEWDERSQAFYDSPTRHHTIAEVLSMVLPEDLVDRAQALAAAVRLDDPQPYFTEYRVRQRDGSLRWLQIKGQATFAGEGAERRAVGMDGTIADVTEAKAAQVAIQASEAKFRQLADAMPQIVWTARPDGVLDYTNRRWYEYIQRAEAEWNVEDWHLRVHPDDIAGAGAVWARSVATGEPYATEFRVQRGDGEYRWFLVRALSIKEPDGRIGHWYGTCTDIQNQRALLEQNASLLDSERAARTEAERIGRMKDEFLATLSHELRTPLNAILGWTQVLRGDPANTEDMEAGLATIERNSRAQNAIIEDLLDMSRIVSGKVRLDVQPLDLDQVVKSAVESMRPAADAKGIRLQALIDPEARMISGDPNRLQQVFWNLLTNAIKFTPKGGKVQVVLERIHSHLEVSVVDSGEGIAPEFLPYVFDRFRQQDASTTRRHGGLGLGLAIVKQLVELHGGSIHADSPGVGQGTAFRVLLPLWVVRSETEPAAGLREHPHATRDTALPIPADRLNLTGVKVLVVDDEADARALLKRLLEDCGAAVDTAGSAAQALERLGVRPPDVLVSDIGMPGEDGFSLIRRVRALAADQGGKVPAVALTAYARSEDRLKVILEGFQAHLAKPVEAAELLALVASLAGRVAVL